jgi:hypothetical protein
MPVVAKWNGSRMVHTVVEWPPECELRQRRAEDMTKAELREELDLLMTFREEDLHKACCINPGCPAKR